MSTPPARILVYGVTGSGKTTLARRVGAATGVPWHSADDEIGWLPGWTQRPLEEQRSLAEQICAEPAWVLDTAYGTWADVPLSRAELIVALDYPRWLSLHRLVRRTLRRAITREEACNGNVESWRTLFSTDSIILWHFRSWARKRARIRQWAADPATARVRAATHGRTVDPTPPRVVHLRTPDQTEAWLATLGQQGPAG